MTKTDQKESVLQPQPPPLAGAPGRRFCPHCGVRVTQVARKCRACGEFLDDRYRSIDEGTFRFVRLVVLADIKQEIMHWLRTVVLGTSVAGLLLLLFGGSGILSRMAYQEVDDAIDASVGQQIEKAKQDVGLMQGLVDETQLKLEELDKLSSDMDLQLNRISTQSAAALATTNSLNLIQVAQLELHLEQRLARMGSLELGEPPTVHLVQPGTLEGEIPRVFFKRDAPLRFEWMESRQGVEDPRYRLQISRDPEFRDPSSTAELQTPFTMKFIDPDLVRGQLGEFVGAYYWRVLRDADPPTVVSPVGVFEFHETALERIVRTGEVRVGVSAVHAPPFLVSTPTGGLGGVDADLARSLAERMRFLCQQRDPEADDLDFRASFYSYDWLPLLSAPARREVDVIISSITIKPDREFMYGLAFTDPYHRTGQSLLMNGEAAERVTSIADLGDLYLAAQKGTSGERVIEHHGTGDAMLNIEDLFELLSWVRDQSLTEQAGADVRWRAAVLDEEIAHTAILEYSSLVAIPLRTLTHNEEPVTPETHPEAFDEYGLAVATGEIQLVADLNYLLGTSSELMEDLRAKYLEPEEKR